jgi:hypothetical protein
VYCSGEVRWFYRGTAASSAERWMNSGELARNQAERTDRYLLLPGCQTAGVKLRDGNFEIKGQTSGNEFIVFADNVDGYRNTWVRWSRPIGDFSDLTRDVREDESWILVRKRRKVRLFSLDTGIPEEVESGVPGLAAGCQVEKTAIRALPLPAADGAPPDADWSAAEDWWTFSFESFGRPESLLRNLDTTVTHVASAEPGLLLRSEYSMSYPEWLSAL